MIALPADVATSGCCGTGRETATRRPTIMTGITGEQTATAITKARKNNGNTKEAWPIVSPAVWTASAAPITSRDSPSKQYLTFADTFGKLLLYQAVFVLLWFFRAFVFVVYVYPT